MADKKISALTAASTPLAGTEVLPIVQSGATVKVSSDNLTVKNIRSNATTGILQVAGPAAAATRTMTVPDANFTAARTDASQTFTNTQEFTQDSASSQIRLTRTGSFAGTATMGTNEFVTIAFNNGSVDQFFINRNAASNAVEITSDSNLKVLSGKGIDFSANTHAPGMTSELLNDYEEGTWTPTDGSGAGLTFTVTSATYTKIGRVVHCHLLITYPATANILDAKIGGIPFPSSITTNAYLGSTAMVGIAIQPAGATNFSILNAIGAGAVTNATLSGALVYGTFTYFV